MPGRRLQWCWRCVLAAYLLTLATIATRRLVGGEREFLVALLVVVLVVGALGVMIWLRPRPSQRSGDGREQAETLRALRRGQFTGSAEQRTDAIDGARRTLFGLLPQVLLWSVLALNNLDGRRVGDWLTAVTVVALVGCAVGLVLARWRMVQLDRWEGLLQHRLDTLERHTAAATPASPTSPCSPIAVGNDSGPPGRPSSS